MSRTKSVLADDGTLLGRVAGRADGDWMTSDPVRFRAHLEVDLPAGVQAGRLVVEADDPSGSGKAPRVEIRVEFAPVASR